MKLFNDISYTNEELQPIVDWCEDNKNFSPVITKFNKKNQWTAISIRGYANDMTQIGKGDVLGTTEVSNLQNTPLYDELQMESILEKIPAEKERVRLMRLEAGTIIAKHTDKVDKAIKDGKIVRLHIPIKTSMNVHFYLWNGKDQYHFNLETGKYYYTDVSKPHAVHNKWDEDRLHLVVDCYNNEKLENLLHIDNTEK